ncbi:MAG: monothiol glutaredoxin, partial [Myxococcota bacterium]
HMSDATHAKIEDLVKSHDILLFMKGTKVFPQCGFSSTVVGLLNDLDVNYETVNVLSDPDIRSGIKAYSDWPTIPQLYIKGEFVGGCDIVRAMYSNGELHDAVGVKVEPVEAPEITVTDAAAAVLTDAASREAHSTLRFEIAAGFQYGLSFGPEKDGDLKVEANGLTILFDRGSAKRANGMTLDFDAAAEGFHIDNPNEPPSVQEVTAVALKVALDANAELNLYDVRTDEERAGGFIPGSVQMNPATQDIVLALDRDTPLYFTCHHGGRSMQAAQFFLGKGFKKVYNVQGGIDAWSQHVDPSVPRY